MELLQAGVDCSVNALWLSHEAMEQQRIANAGRAAKATHSCRGNTPLERPGLSFTVIQRLEPITSPAATFRPPIHFPRAIAASPVIGKWAPQAGRQGGAPSAGHGTPTQG